MSEHTAPVVKSFAGSVRDERCLEVWFADKVTDDTRTWLLEAINEKTMRANQCSCALAGFPHSCANCDAEYGAIKHWRERALHAETVLTEQDARKADKCPGCDGHECDDGCQYPGAAARITSVVGSLPGRINGVVGTVPTREGK